MTRRSIASKEALALSIATVSQWPALGTCAQPGMDPDLWHDDKRWGYARHICINHCPVLAECNAWAQQHPIGGTVLGGLLWVEGHESSPAVIQPDSPYCSLCKGNQ
jgi:hypothetical protein